MNSPLNQYFGKQIPGKHRNVPFFLGNWIAGFGGFKLMEINFATAVFQVRSFHLFANHLQIANLSSTNQTPKPTNLFGTPYLEGHPPVS